MRAVSDLCGEYDFIAIYYEAYYEARAKSPTGPFMASAPNIVTNIFVESLHP
jgi:hypothetical protein